MRLSELRTGEKGVIVKVLGHGGFRKRIVEMGFIKGKTVEVILNAPLKDPIKYRLLGYEISLRRQEADMIEVVSEQEARTMQNPYHGSITEDVPVSESELVALAKGKRRTINVALVGNPNCGKTSLFNIASGAHEHVGNYSGVTVDAKEGFFDFQGYHFRIVDLPGTYSLSAYTPEELYVRKHIIEETPDVIINVADSSNLERNFYLTTQLIDMNVRMVIALNMYDELESSGNKLDYIKLSQLIGVPMIPTVCRRGEGIDQLFHVIIGIYEGGDFLSQKGEIRSEILEDLRDWHKTYVPDHEFGSHKEEEDARPRGYMRHIHINHGPELERSIEEVKKAISQNEDIRHKYSTRFLSIKLLENDKEIENFISTLPNGKEIIAIRNKETLRIRKVMNEDSEQAITDAKYGFITGALKETFTDNHLEKEQTTRVIDSIVTHRIWGYPIFFLFLYIMFEGTFVLGDYPMQGIEWLVDQLGNLIRNNMAEGPLKDLLIDGIIGGVGGVIVFLPNILILYFFISILEDSGYMARAAFIMDKIMHRMGLHGKSFIPLIMGFGCNVPAIMATRTIEDRKSRLITMLVNPLMSCSARLPIYLVMIGAFFPNCASFMLLCIYTAGILLAVIMARIFSKFLVKGEDSPFVMELPPYRMPTSKSIMRHTWEKGAQYLKKMGGIILVASLIIWMLSYFPRPTEEQEATARTEMIHDGNTNVTPENVTKVATTENSCLARLGKLVQPVFEPLGFNWKMTVSLISGTVAKETVVSTLGVLYSGDSENEAALAERIQKLNPKTGVPDFTPLVAACFMLFVLIYVPCIATITAIVRETGSWRYGAFTLVYNTFVAWLIAFAVYQIGTLFM